MGSMEGIPTMLPFNKTGKQKNGKNQNGKKNWKEREKKLDKNFLKKKTTERERLEVNLGVPNTSNSSYRSIQNFLRKKKKR